MRRLLLFAAFIATIGLFAKKGGGDGPTLTRPFGGDSPVGGITSGAGSIKNAAKAAEPVNAITGGTTPGRPPHNPPAGSPVGDSPMYRSDGDPAADVFGPGEVSNPAEWNALLDEFRAAGVEINRDTTNIGYAPANRPGSPGQLHLPYGCSYSALLHEASHFRDDQAVGWGGFQQAYDTEFMTQSEATAYNIEIDYANLHGQPELAADLEALRDARIQQAWDDDKEQREQFKKYEQE
jgi:hypothetical protein